MVSPGWALYFDTKETVQTALERLYFHPKWLDIPIGWPGTRAPLLSPIPAVTEVSVTNMAPPDSVVHVGNRLSTLATTARPRMGSAMATPGAGGSATSSGTAAVRQRSSTHSPGPAAGSSDGTPVRGRATARVPSLPGGLCTSPPHST